MNAPDPVVGNRVGTAALPRSGLHIQFLLDNAAQPDLVLYRDAHLAAALDRHYPGRSLYLGREERPRKRPADLLRCRAANRGYYRRVAAKIMPLQIDRLILFLEGEPLERMLLDLPAARRIELWEDGLSHYVDLTNPLWYAARGLVQSLAGFYPDQIMRRRIDRRRVTVRDRFERGDLRLIPPPAAGLQREEVLFIGSPLVEDGVIKRSRFTGGMAMLAAAAPLPIRYLPHPREDVARLGSDLPTGIAIAIEPNGLSSHVAMNGYRAYVTALSTGLLDIARYEYSLFAPALFGLKRAGAALEQWEHNPVAVARNMAGLSDFFVRIMHQSSSR